MVNMHVKIPWTLALIVFSCTFQTQGEYTKETITYLRLLNGTRDANTYQGRVVIQINNEGIDGAICGTWTNNNAAVVCRMLGYSAGNSVAYHQGYGRGNHNFLMSSLKCNGSEELLTDCAKDAIVNCPYDSPDVVVSCSNPVTPMERYAYGDATQANRVAATTVPMFVLTNYQYFTNCSTPGNIRLHGLSDRPGMGYVQVNVNGVWQYICDDRWSENDAKVVCRELCYNGPACPRPGVENQYWPQLGVNQQPTFAWNTVQCTGAEASLSSCARNTTAPNGQCSRQELAGVQCVVPPKPVKPMNASLECSELNGDIVLQLNQEDFPQLNPNNVKVINPNSSADCATLVRVSPLSGEYRMRISPQKCGTMKTDNGSAICYINKVQYDNEVYVRNVLLDYMKKTYTVECCMPTDKDVSIKFVPKTQEYTQSYSKNFDYTPEISFYQNERCDVKITDNPYSIEVGDWVYIGVSVNANNMSLFRDNDLKLVVERCTANPIKGVPGPIDTAENITLIENKCPAEVASLTTYPISNTTEGFRFRAFKFFGYSSVYVTCHLRVCLTTDPKPQCDRSCLSNGAGRKRRTVGDKITGLDTVISQVLHIADPKQPKVNTQLHEERTAESINPRFIKH